MWNYRSPLTLLTILVCAASWLMAIHTASRGESVSLDKRRVAGALVYVITCDLRDPTLRITIGTPSGNRRSEPFSEMIRRDLPIAAVTGTYFDTRTLLPVGSILVGGQVIHTNAIGTSVCFIRNQRGTGPEDRASYIVKLLDTPAGQRCDWSGVECGLRAGPRLLADGRYVFNPRKEGFRNPGLFGSRVRMALGVTHRDKLLMAAVRTPVTFARTATIMKALGTRDALCLDGGTSSAMYYRGRIVCRPGRKLTNIIEIIKEPEPPAPTIEASNPPYAEGTMDAGIAIRRPSGTIYIVRAFVPEPLSAPFTPEHQAIPVDPIALRGSQSLIPFVPIDRAKLARLKRFKNPQHLVHVSPDVQVVHHLVA